VIIGSLRGGSAGTRGTVDRPAGNG
jgi:hypothetical protein